MIVGLSGSHGTGKSTLLADVLTRSNFAVDQTQLSRTAQARLGWDRLSYAEESIENAWLLQEAILASMFDRDEPLIKSKALTLVDRTPADVWAYTVLWLTRQKINVIKDPRAQEFKGRCRMMASRYAGFIYVPINDQIKFVEEIERADKISQMEVATSIEDFLWSGNLPVYSIKCLDKTERAFEVLTNLAIIKAANL